MRTTLDLDDALVARAKFLTVHDDIAKILHGSAYGVSPARERTTVGSSEWD
jgi:hypothetical protein